MVKRTGERVQEYWDISFPDRHAASTRPVSDYAEELHALLAETVKPYTGDADSQTALLLSGGLDSSIIGYLGVRHQINWNSI